MIYPSSLSALSLHCSFSLVVPSAVTVRFVGAVGTWIVGSFTLTVTVLSAQVETSSLAL